MAFPSNQILTAFVFLVAFETCLPSSTASLVSDVCSHAAPDPQFCISTFGSGSRADLATLGQTGINSAQSIADVTISVLNSIVGGTSDPTAKKRYISCFNSYNSTHYELEDCRSALNGKDYGTLSLKASAALKASQSCDEQFGPSPVKPSPLKEPGVQVQTLSSALVYIASQLKQGH